MGRQAVEAVWRIESARIVGALARYTGDFAMAEDLAQEALAEALVSWPRDGVPQQPVRLAAHRRPATRDRRLPAASALDERYAAMASELDEGEATSGAAPHTGEEDDVLYDPERIDDDVLALVFISCHPVLSREASVALTLRVLGGLTSDEIARAFVTPTATVQARITRAKKTLGAAQVPFEVPPYDERKQRLSSVLTVIYLIFTEGSSATSGSEWIRTDLAREAIRQARVLARLMPDEPETHGLLALLELTAARFPARAARRRHARCCWRTRTAAAGTGRRSGAAAQPWRSAGRIGRGLGAYGLQASIAECHAVAPSVEATDWDRIVLLYDALGSLAPSPIVELNRAVAVSMASGPGGRPAAGRRAGRTPAASPARTCSPACAASC